MRGWEGLGVGVAKCAKSLLAKETGKRVANGPLPGGGKWEENGRVVDYTIWTMNRAPGSKFAELPTAYALLLKESVGTGGFPAAAWWERTPPIQFDRDWRGEHTDPERATEVRLLWNEQTLFLRFIARYRELHVFPDARADGWRDELWERDVAEAFLQPYANDARVYKELEVSPNGYWIDLNIGHGEKEEMRSGLRRRVVQDATVRTWTAELAVPIRSLTLAFDPKQGWRANFFRVEGRLEPRFYSAWSPTFSPTPNFHVPEAFGHLEFREG
jgi:alpha-galactosidase